MAPPAPAYPKKEKCKPGVPMKQLHWALVPDKRLKGSVWDKEVDDTKVLSTHGRDTEGAMAKSLPSSSPPPNRPHLAPPPSRWHLSCDTHHSPN